MARPNSVVLVALALLALAAGVAPALGSDAEVVVVLPADGKPSPRAGGLKRDPSYKELM